VKKKSGATYRLNVSKTKTEPQDTQYSEGGMEGNKHEIGRTGLRGAHDKQSSCGVEKRREVWMAEIRGEKGGHAE